MEEPKEETKEETKEEPKEETKGETKEETKEEPAPESEEKPPMEVCVRDKFLIFILNFDKCMHHT